MKDNGFAAGSKAVGQEGIYGQNPNYGITHFDNVASAFLTIFQCITLEGWTDVMYMVQDAEGGFATFFFFAIILVGSLIVLSLLLAVIEGTYSEEKERVEEEDAALEKAMKLEAAESANLNADADSPKPNGGVIVEGMDGECSGPSNNGKHGKASSESCMAGTDEPMINTDWHRVGER